MGNRLKMFDRRVEASAVTANVIELEARRHGTDVCLVRDDVHASLFWLPVGRDDDHAVALRDMQFAGPHPAAIFVDSPPALEALLDGQLRHAARLSTGEDALK
jgi:hypothetical protein